MKHTQGKGVLMLLLTAFVWGSSFVAQSVGMQEIEAFTFNGIRTLLGAAVLFPFIIIRDHVNGKNMSDDEIQDKRLADKRVIRSGFILGIVFCGASNFQQFAFYYSASGKIAFITALYMFFVPLFGLFLHKRVSVLTWICIAFGFLGLYFLSIDPTNVSAINQGDILAFICAILYAAHILLIDQYVSDVDGTKLSCMQFIVSGIISCILMFIFESPNFGSIENAAIPLLYSGVMSCGLAYTFQIIGQKYVDATIASLLMCMESVFAVLSGAVILHEIMTAREIIGCIIMFVAIILSQISEMKNSKGKKL